jgi:tetratricopeptide (TPR) repeat protein
VEGVERVGDRLRVGDYKGALEGALSLEDPLRRLIALLKVLEEFPREEILYHMLETLDSIGGTAEKALGLSIVGRASYVLDREEEAEAYFERAIEMASSIHSPRVRGELLGGIARNLARAERFTDSYLLFVEAVETLQSARGFSSDVITALLKVARLIEKSADEASSDVALDLYRLARDVYESAHFTLQARYLEDRISLIEDVLKKGRRTVDELIEKGEVMKAVEVMRFLEPGDRAIEMLKLTHWLFLHGRETLAKEVMQDALDLVLVGKFDVRDAEVAGVARSLIRIGRLEEPLILAGTIRDIRLASEVLGEVALAYARAGEPVRARSIAEGIADESVKRRVLKALKGDEDVGHEQGLPLTGRGEERGAVSENGGTREVQGEVGQEESHPARKGNGS